MRRSSVMWCRPNASSMRRKPNTENIMSNASQPKPSPIAYPADSAHKPANQKPKRAHQVPSTIPAVIRAGIPGAVSAGRSVVQEAKDSNVIAITVAELWLRAELRMMKARLSDLEAQLSLRRAA